MLPWERENGKTFKLNATPRDELFLAFTSNPVHVSRLQQNVIHFLRGLCPEVKEEDSTQMGYSLDALVSWCGHEGELK
eukprot:5562191-Karenia_brevis.AAC.1